MPLSLEQFTQQITGSGLMADGDVRAFVAALPEGQRPRDAQALARLLVRDKKLTAFQAQTLYQNKGNTLVLGNYVILDKLGQGGMGMVLKALHRRMQRIVALKVLSPTIVKTPDLLERFLREVRAAARLTHPNIVAAFDADETKGSHFLVMEFVDGTDLSAVVKQQGPLPVNKATDCVLQAARGLQYAHDRGVVHRDIKPANLLLDSHGTVKILDMGLARIDEGDGSQHDLTSTGAVMGTVDYMAPEQALSTKKADARSDIYSLGITLWYLLTARPAYEGDSLMARLLRHRESPIPKLSEARGDASPALQSIFEKMVAKQPEHRYQSMADVVSSLQGLLEGTHQVEVLVAAPSEDSKLSEFLGQLGSVEANSRSGRHTAVKTRPAPAARASDAATLASGDMTSQTDPVSMSLPARGRERPKQASLATPRPWWQDRRIQIGSAAALVVLLGVAFFLSGGKDSSDVPQLSRRPETLLSEPATGPSRGTGATTPPAAPPPTTASWEPLFDGSDVSRWQTLGPFAIENGLLTAASGGNAVTRDVYGDFELELEWKIDPGGNGGIYYRIPREHAKPGAFAGTEYQLLDDTGHPNGRNPKTSAAALYGVIAPTNARVRPLGLFNSTRIVCRGSQVEHWLNGQLVVRYDQDDPQFQTAVSTSSLPDKTLTGAFESGHILLQGHTNRISFRNIRIRRLNDALNSTGFSTP